MSIKKATVTVAPAPGLEAADVARDLLRLVKTVLGAAVSASPRPGLAVSAMFVAAKALARGAVDAMALSEDDVTDAKAFATELVRGPVMPDMVHIAQQEITRRSLRANAQLQDIRETIDAATKLLEFMRRAGHQHQITQLVILSTARIMALALLEHSDPDGYEENVSIVRGMENAMRPVDISVVIDDTEELEAVMVPMSKGGDA